MDNHVQYFDGKCKREGSVESIKKTKIPKIRAYASAFTRLEGFVGDGKEGVRVFCRAILIIFYP